MTHFSSHVSLGGSTSNGSWMRSINIPQHIKFFLWLTSHKSFPTNTFLTFRHLSTDEFCCRCLDQEETILHILRDSQKAQQVWHFFHHALQVDFMEQDSATWLQHHMALAQKFRCLLSLAGSFGGVAIPSSSIVKTGKIGIFFLKFLLHSTLVRVNGVEAIWTTQLSIFHGVCHHRIS